MDGQIVYFQSILILLHLPLAKSTIFSN